MSTKMTTRLTTKQINIKTGSSNNKASIEKRTSVSRNNSYVSVSYDGDDDNKDTPNNIILKLRYQLAEALADNESLSAETVKLKEKITYLEREVKFGIETAANLKGTIDKLVTRKTYSNTASQTEIQHKDSESQTTVITKDSDSQTTETDVSTESKSTREAKQDPTDNSLKMNNISENATVNNNNKTKEKTVPKKIDIPPKQTKGYISDSAIKRSKILILSDDFGHNINKLVYNKLNKTTYQIEAVFKPGASLKQVIEDIENLTGDYSLQDHVVVIAGSNNFNSQNKYPLFKDIVNKIKKCPNTNITIATAPFKSKKANKYICKYNKKLNEFIFFLDNNLKSNLNVLNVNSKNFSNLNKNQIANNIVKIVLGKNNLIIINNKQNFNDVTIFPDVIDVDNSYSTNLNKSDTLNEISNKNSSNFLYPVLSQSLLIT